MIDPADGGIFIDAECTQKVVHGTVLIARTLLQEAESHGWVHAPLLWDPNSFLVAVQRSFKSWAQSGQITKEQEALWRRAIETAAKEIGQYANQMVSTHSVVAWLKRIAAKGMPKE